MKLNLLNIRTKQFIVLIALTIGTILFTHANEYLTANKERKVEKFTGIKLQISADIYLQQGDKQSIRIEAPEDVIENIETEVTGEILKIKYKKWYKNNNSKATIYITIEEIKDINVSGSGKIIAENKIKTEDLYLSISGSGNIKLKDLEASDVDSDISGSGSIYISGKHSIETLSIDISGSGNINCVELEAEEVRARISGSGNCKVNASETIDAIVSGSGRIYYKGKPQIDANISGSGNIKSLD